MIKIKIHRSKDNQYYTTVVARNGKVLFTSEMYKRKRNTLKAIAALKTDAEVIDTTV